MARTRKALQYTLRTRKAVETANMDHMAEITTGAGSLVKTGIAAAVALLSLPLRRARGESIMLDSRSSCPDPRLEVVIDRETTGSGFGIVEEVLKRRTATRGKLENGSLETRARRHQ